MVGQAMHSAKDTTGGRGASASDGISSAPGFIDNQDPGSYGGKGSMSFGGHAAGGQWWLTHGARHSAGERGRHGRRGWITHHGHSAAEPACH